MTDATAPLDLRPSRARLTLRYLRRNKSLSLGLAIMLGLIAFTVIGFLTIDTKDAYPLSAPTRRAPSWDYPLGTDFFGRNLLAAMVVGMWQTAAIGFLAGLIGTVIGVILGFISAYFGGIIDSIIKNVCLILTPIPVLLIQVVVAGSLDKRDVTILMMAFIIVMLGWMGTTLVVRAQVLTMKERQFVAVAKLSGMGSMGIIFKEIMPNLLPFIAAAFVVQVFAAVFASFYLAVLGLGPLREPLLGNIIWAAQGQGAFFNGWWWWPIAPSVAMILILGSLALINMGLDELANPRVRKSMMTAPTPQPVLRVENLDVTYYTDAGRAKALDDVSFTLKAGQKMGMVGESGSGKSTLALAMMRMIKPPGRIEGGRVWVGETDLMALDDDTMRKSRLSKIAYIPQGAMNSLNPVTRIGAQLVDAIRSHRTGDSKSQLEEQGVAALKSVDLDPRVFRMYAHELSGGMKQRVCIAIGILLSPQVIIADEPTSALDVVTQRQVMETIDRVKDQIGAAVILIGHDMGLMAQFVDRVAVMYAGRLVEVSDVRDMFLAPKHPYAQALIRSLPNLDNKGVFQGIPGLAPSLLRLPSGCAFHPRCDQVRDACRTVRPVTRSLPDGRLVTCHLYDGGA